MPMLRTFCLAVCLVASMGQVQAGHSPADDDLDALQEKAILAAVARVAPSVVQIETSGGADLIGSGPRGGQTIRKGAGPTTGLVVSADGYVISSAFNFANKPSAIFVAVPGRRERLVAKLVATDQTRMLTLLKVEATELPVPVPAPKKQFRVGQTVLALGRTWTGVDQPPSLSVGILSALERIWGKAVQTDAKVSPVNYGGPLIDLSGRVIGVLVPASPRGQEETAGVEWYDAGIGFAVPLEDINAVLPKLREGKDLKRGLLGVSLESEDLIGGQPVIALVAPDSAALRAGLKAGDVIIEIDGKPVLRQAHMMHLLGGKYENDTVSLKVRRGTEEKAFAKLTLTASQGAFLQPFLGVLPLRDDPELGEAVRQVFPRSPADVAGIKAGDRIMKLGVGKGEMVQFSGRDQLTSLLDRLPIGTVLQLELKRKESKKTEKVEVTLGAMSLEIPEILSEPASLNKAQATRKQARQPRQGPPGTPPAPKETKPAPKETKASNKKPETGLLKRTTPAGDHEYWLSVPKNYDPNIAHAVVVWLHPAGRARDKERETEQVIAAWEDYCQEKHIILVCPKAESETGWVGSETEFILSILQTVAGEYTVDRQRVVAHGLGMGGQFAYYLGFNLRDWFRGVAVANAALNSQPREGLDRQRLAFFVIAGIKDPLKEAIEDGRKRLEELKFPVVYRESADLENQYLDALALDELVRWIDSLDRQ
jgi:S1-C subfamily serine protease/predicted esterase